jgi:hypothetical protein
MMHRALENSEQHLWLASSFAAFFGCFEEYFQPDYCTFVLGSLP